MAYLLRFSPEFRRYLTIVTRVLVVTLRFAFWILIAIAIYNISLNFALTVREYVFQNLCPSNVRYPLQTWNPITDYHNRVDWCDTSWWHTFRLSTRIYYGFVAGGLISLSAWILIPTRGIANSFAIRFVVLLCLIHALLIMTEIMINYTQNACLWRWYDTKAEWDDDSYGDKYWRLTMEDCRIQLGSFGDQRFYFPLATLATCLIARRQNLRRIQGKTNAPESQARP